jgi:hypothetical protein
MFDANMRQLPFKTDFFAKVHYCNIGCELYNLGVRDGQIVKCKMLSPDNENPRVLFKLKSGDHEVYSDTEYTESWVVYEGKVDGSDFINNESKTIAMNML